MSSTTAVNKQRPVVLVCMVTVQMVFKMVGKTLARKDKTTKVQNVVSDSLVQ